MKKRISFCTLGCRVNQYESDVYRSFLENEGFITVPFGEECDVCVVNTCAVTSESGRKSKQMIRRAARYSHGHAVVCGCFSEIAPADIASIKGVIYYTGNKDKSSVTDAVRYAAGITDTPPDKPGIFEPCGGTLTRPDRVRSFIKIEDGCEHRCAYCIISTARGPVRSKMPDEIIKEAKILASAGSPEVILTGIEISEFGKDFTGELKGYNLSSLIRDISSLNEIKRLALGSLDPTLIKEDFMKVAAESPVLLRHYHLSLQSGCSETLRRMRRGYNADMARRAIETIRRYVPDAMISADIIVGFPGESESDFLECAEFCKDADFLNLHIFPYSVREGTEAASMAGQIPEQEKKRRVSYLENIHSETKKELLRRYSLSGKPSHVLFERSVDGILSGHSEHYVEIFAEGGEEYVGKICTVFPDENCRGTIIK